ncbi:Non-catalytic module family DOC2, partial [Piromyces sp. E2]
CFSKSQGIPCCSKNAGVVYEDYTGSWGVENGQWCGIGNGKKSTPTNCFAKALGYPCCSSGNTNVIFTDSSGKWGAENGNWCGIGTSS